MPIALPISLRRLITNLPLRGVLVVPFVLQTVGAVVLVGYWSYRSGQEAVTDLGQRLVAETNERVTQELKTYLQTPILINRLNVDAVNQGQIDPQNIPALESALFNRLQQFDQVSAILFASPQGTFRVVERFPTLYLGVADPPRPDQIRIYPLDRQGKPGKLIRINDGLDVRRDSQRESCGKLCERFTNRPWYKRAVATGQPGWNAIAQYGSFKLLTLNASQPIYDRTTKRLLGVFAVHIRLDYLNNFLNRLDVSRSGQVLIVDQNGALLATSTGEQLYQSSAGTEFRRQFKQLKIDQSQDGLTRSLGEYLRERPNTLGLNQPQYLEFHHNGELHNVRITPFQDQYGLNWRILTVIPKSHFIATIQSNTRTTVLLCLLTLGTAIALGLLAANQIIARFAQFNQVSRELAAGNLDRRLPTDSPIAELNSLAQTFNQMADQLQQSFDLIQIALAESEEKFTIIFRSSPDPIALTTLLEVRCVEANDSFLKMLEYSREELIGQRLVDFGIWVDRDNRAHVRQRLRQQGRVRNLEVQLGTRTGSIKTVLLSAELIEISGETYVLGVGKDISDRKRDEDDLKQAEAALRQSETLNRTILNALPDLIIRMHRDGTYLDFKPTNAFPIGFPNLKRGENICNILPSETAQRRLAAATTALQTGEIQVYEFPLWVEEQPLWQEARVMPLDTDEVLVVIRDLTQRKQAETALQASEARFRELAETVQEGFFVYEIESAHYSYVNPAYEAIIGTSPQLSHQGMSHWLNNIHPGDRDLVEAALQREGEGVNFDQEYRYILPDGEIRWLRSQAFPLRNEAGAMVRVVGTVEDISDRKRVEAALREREAMLRDSEEKFRKAFDGAPIGVSLVSATGQFLKVNPSYCTIVGYLEAELLALTFHDITHPADLKSDLQGFEQMLAGQLRSFQMEKRYITKQGTIVPVIINTAPIRDHNGELLYVVGHTQDIRDRLKVERMKDEFVSVVSHELRTPLTSIRGALGILESGIFNDRPEKAQHMLKIALNNSDRLVRLVNDILDLERLESGKVRLVMEPCPVTSLMSQAIDGVQAIADQSTITLSLTPLSAILWAAPDAIIQTLTNLLSNAIKFSSSGDTVWLKAEMGNGWGTDEANQPNSSALSIPKSAAILFSIADQGRGIPPDKLELIFEQFQQVDVSDSREKGGTGLGLAICRNIVQQHGGQIWVESTLGKGSTFYFTLPLSCEVSGSEFQVLPPSP